MIQVVIDDIIHLRELWTFWVDTANPLSITLILSVMTTICFFAFWGLMALKTRNIKIGVKK